MIENKEKYVYYVYDSEIPLKSLIKIVKTISDKFTVIRTHETYVLLEYILHSKNDSYYLDLATRVILSVAKILTIDEIKMKLKSRYIHAKWPFSIHEVIVFLNNISKSYASKLIRGKNVNPNTRLKRLDDILDKKTYTELVNIYRNSIF